MAGETNLSEVATPTSPVAGTESLFISNDATPRLKRLLSDGSTRTIIETGVAAPAGTAATPPFQLQAGTNLTTPAAGAFEYDGNAFYISPGASMRSVNAGIIFTSTTADFTGTNVNTAQPVFNTTEDVLTVPASTSYLMRAVYHIHTTGTTSHQLGILFGGTATITSIGYSAQATNAATEVLGADSTIWVATAAVTNVSPATATATHHTVRLEGIVRINAAGTFIPQYQWSAAPGVAGVTLQNSFFMLMPIGSNTVAAVGNWA